MKSRRILMALDQTAFAGLIRKAGGDIHSPGLSRIERDNSRPTVQNLCAILRVTMKPRDNDVFDLMALASAPSTRRKITK